MFEKIEKSTMTDGEKGFLTAVEQGVSEHVAEAVKGLATVEDLNQGKKELADSIASMKAQFEQNATRSETHKSIPDVMAEKYADFMQGGKLDVQAAKSARKGITFQLEQKAAGTTTIAGNITNAPNLGVELLPGIDRYPRAWSPIRDLATVGNVSAPTLIIAEYASGEGGAEWTPEGGLKPLLDADLTQRTITAGKVAVRYKVSEELLQDFPAFEAELRSEAIDSVGLKESAGILNGSGSGGEIVGVSGFMPAYTMQNHEVATPNYFDALYACIMQIRSNTQYNYEPNGVLVNIADYATMMGTKSTTGVPLYADYKEFFQPSFRLIPVNSNVVAAGTFIVGDFSKLQIRDRTPLTVQVGWENDDFSKNLVTVVVEKRLMAYILNQHKYAFVKDTFANVLTAITPSE